MKIKRDFVTNSSSTSFLILSTCASIDEVNAELAKIPVIDHYMDEFRVDKFDLRVDPDDAAYDIWDTMHDILRGLSGDPALAIKVAVDFGSNKYTAYTKSFCDEGGGHIPPVHGDHIGEKIIVIQTEER